MTCPKCGHERSGVIDSRSYFLVENAIRRRRKCFGCAHRWTTIEAEIDTLEDDLRSHMRDQVIAIADASTRLNYLLNIDRNSNVGAPEECP